MTTIRQTWLNQLKALHKNKEKLLKKYHNPELPDEQTEDIGKKLMLIEIDINELNITLKYATIWGCKPM